jgi:hypothetical protein
MLGPGKFAESRAEIPMRRLWIAFDPYAEPILREFSTHVELVQVQIQSPGLRNDLNEILFHLASKVALGIGNETQAI